MFVCTRTVVHQEKIFRNLLFKRQEIYFFAPEEVWYVFIGAVVLLLFTRIRWILLATLTFTTELSLPKVKISQFLGVSLFAFMKILWSSPKICLLSTSCTLFWNSEKRFAAIVTSLEKSFENKLQLTIASRNEESNKAFPCWYVCFGPKYRSQAKNRHQNWIYTCGSLAMRCDAMLYPALRCGAVRAAESN